MKFWEKPLPRILALFLFLGLFGWWTFRTVSLTPALRDLFEEDQAIAAAAVSPSEEEILQTELESLPRPPAEHAPEVAALLARLQALPPLAVRLENALRRDASTPPGTPPQPWDEAELQDLAEARAAFRAAWEPFLFGTTPDWRRFPDSAALFRFQGDFFSADWKPYADLVNYQPATPENDGALADPEFTFAYLRQIRNLGSAIGNETDAINLSARAAKTLETRILPEIFSLDTLLAVRQRLPAPLTLEDLRAALDADESLLKRAADYFASLPPATRAGLALTRWLGKKAEEGWVLTENGRLGTAGDLASGLQRKAAELDGLRQKTFLSGPAWRQWSAADPGTGLPSWMAPAMAGFRYFERGQTEFRVLRSALEVRIALEQGGLAEARKIPDPLQAGSFFQVEETAEGFRASCSYRPPEAAEPASFLFPFPAKPNPTPEG